MVASAKTMSIRQEAKLGLGKRAFRLLQRVGKSLLFPIAMLPFAAIMLRIGAEIPGDTQFSAFVGSILMSIGNAVFGPALPFMFALGIGFGMTKDSRGEAAIAALASMILITILMSSKGPFGNQDIVEKIYGSLDLHGNTNVVKMAGHFKGGLDPSNGAGQGDWIAPEFYKTGFHTIFENGGTNKYSDILSQNVLTGIFAGGLVAYVYNKFNGIELPSILGFFSGRRLIPVLGFIAATIGGLLYAVIFPWIGYGLFKFSEVLGKASGNRWANAGIMGVYGILNRMLIPFGLHHIPNTIFWFTLPVNSANGGALLDADGHAVSGDIGAFINGVAEGNTSGTFQSGFFPIMMFALPALAVAMWFTADGNIQRKRVAALFVGSSVVSFFTGITEPIEFSFMFAAPALYGMHALLTGVFGFITGVFGIQLGFGFSAGFIDYVLSIPKSMAIIGANKTGFEAIMANPAWIWVIGAAAAATYFFLGTFMIKHFNMNTPGRGSGKIGEKTKEAPINEGDNKYTADGKTIIEAVGGIKNIVSLSNCATRLRFELKSNTKINKEDISKTKAAGQIKVPGGYQIIMGPTVEMYADEIQRLMKLTK